jgi:hypothetical protein
MRSICTDVAGFLEARDTWINNGRGLNTEPRLVTDYWNDLEATSAVACADMLRYADEVRDAMTVFNIDDRLLGVKAAAEYALRVPDIDSSMCMVEPPSYLNTNGGTTRRSPRVPDLSKCFESDGDAAFKKLLTNTVPEPLAACLAHCILFTHHRHQDEQSGGVVVAGGAAVAMAHGSTDFSDVDWFVTADNETHTHEIIQLWTSWIHDEVRTVVMGVWGSTAWKDRFIKIERIGDVVNVCIEFPNDTSFCMQLVCRPRRSISQVLYNFDLKCCQAAFDGAGLLVTPAFVETTTRGVEIIDPYKDRNGRYGRRLLKYMTRFNMTALIPGWDPRILEALPLGCGHDRKAILKLARQLDGRGVLFALLYNAVRVWGKSALVTRAAYVSEPGPGQSQQEAHATPPMRGMDARPRDMRTTFWIDGEALGFLVDELQDKKYTPN